MSGTPAGQDLDRGQIRHPVAQSRLPRETNARTVSTTDEQTSARTAPIGAVHKEYRLQPSMTDPRCADGDATSIAGQWLRDFHTRYG